MNFDETRSLDLDFNNIEENMNIDVRNIIEKIDNTVSGPDFLDKTQNLLDQIRAEGRWISVMTPNYTISAYFHPTKKHSATVINGFFFKTISRVIEEKGKWAIAYLPRALFFNRTKYNVLAE